MKHIKLGILLLSFILIFVMTGCTNQNSKLVTSSNTESGKLKVIASLFPQYDFANQIGGDLVETSLILPPGVEAHAFDPTPRDIISISESEIFLYTSDDMEPWVSSLIENIDIKKTQVIDLSKNVTLIKADHHQEEGETHEESEAREDEDDHEEGEEHYDPHYWLDPQNAMIMVADIKAALVLAMPENEAVFTENADRLIAELKALDEEIEGAVSKFESRTILSGGHFAFGYFAHRYGLEHMSPYNGFSPDAEPLNQNIQELIDTIEKSKTNAIFYEELIDPRVAETLSEQTGAKMYLLHGAHNLSKEELKAGITYVQIMKDNLERLKVGLGYHE